MSIPLLSFFTGGGFLDLGFKQAGFDVKWTNEYNPAFVKGYEYGMSAWLQATGKPDTPNVSISNSNSITQLTADIIINEAFCEGRPDVFGMIGGPPCPDFSAGGKHAGGEGNNGKLTSTFVNLICEILPTFFIIENVAGLYRFKKHRAFLEEKLIQLQNSGYLVDRRILNALEFGVPQDRERLFIVGLQKDLANTLDLSIDSDLPYDWYPWPSLDAYKGAKSYAWPKTSQFGDLPEKPEDLPIELTVNHAFSMMGDPEKIPNGDEYFMPHSNKFQEICEGDVYKKSFKRLHRYRYSPTAWYGNQEVHLHPWKPRRLSVREAMRIQSVPDEYVLPGNMSLSAKFKLISNGVPCRLAYHLGMSIHELLVNK